AAGKLKFELQGERLQGAWMLVRMGGKAAQEKRDNWLLIKERDDHARPGEGTALIDEEITSVDTGRTMEAIAADVDRVGHSDRPAEDQPEAAPAKGKSKGKAKSEFQAEPSARVPRPADLTGAARAKLSESPRPQLASLVSRAPVGAAWIHEIKFDGYRAIAQI